MGGVPRHAHWSTLHYSLAHSLAVLAERIRPPGRFLKAAAAFRAYLEGSDPIQNAPGWAVTQTNLGTSLRLYAKQTGDPAARDEAIAAYRAALTVALPEDHTAIRTQAEALLNEAIAMQLSPPPA